MHGQRKFSRFDEVLLPHLDAAYNLARWLTRREHDADDVVQEAYLRACKAFDQFHGDDARCWLLTIVRNTCYTWLTRNRERAPTASFDEALHDVPTCTLDPHALLEQSVDRAELRQAIEALPVEFREVLVLREFEALSYRQVAAVVNIPIGTVMSRLARARERLAQALAGANAEGGRP